MTTQRELRKQQMDDAIANLRAEGQEPSDFAKKLAEEYVEGKISALDLANALMDYHHIPRPKVQPVGEVGEAEEVE